MHEEISFLIFSGSGSRRLLGLHLDHPAAEATLNETPTLPVLYHNNVAVNLSAIEIKDPELFTANLTSTISTVLPDSRAGLLLDHGWNITSVRQEFDEEVLDRSYVRVEFMKNNLSFHFLVDEENGRIVRGYCGAKVWVAGPISGPLPKDYSRASTRLQDRCGSSITGRILSG